MIRKEMIDWINQNLNRGFKEDSIKDMLLSQEYSKKDIDDTLKYAQEADQGTPGGISIKTISRKSIWLYASLPVIILAGLFIFFVLTAQNISVSQIQFDEGTNINLGEGKKAKFVLNEESHTIKINSVGENSVSLIIESEPVELNLTVGEEKSVDLDGDGSYDIHVKLVGIKEGVPELFIKRIPKDCIENWNCGEWEECNPDGIAQRLCKDLNLCGTENERPGRERNCEYNGSLSQGNLTGNRTFYNRTIDNRTNITGNASETGNFNESKKFNATYITNNSFNSSLNNSENSGITGNTSLTIPEEKNETINSNSPNS